MSYSEAGGGGVGPLRSRASIPYSLASRSVTWPKRGRRITAMKAPFTLLAHAQNLLQYAALAVLQLRAHYGHRGAPQRRRGSRLEEGVRMGRAGHRFLPTEHLRPHV